jgi:hypothetical protein
LFQKSKKFRISEFSWVIRSSEVLMGFQKFRSSEVEKLRSPEVLMGYQKFRCSGIPQIPHIQKFSEV